MTLDTGSKVKQWVTQIAMKVKSETEDDILEPGSLLGKSIGQKKCIERIFMGKTLDFLSPTKVSSRKKSYDF